MKRKGIAAALALWALAGASTAQAAEQAKACLTHGEATAVMFVLAPEAIRAAGTACERTLPSTALLRQTSGPFLDGFQAEADRAWPRAQSGLTKLAGDNAMAALLEPEVMKPLLKTMIVPMIANEIKPKDCAAIDHIVTQLAPLPPGNLVELVITVLELESASKASKGKKDGLPICPALKP